MLTLLLTYSYTIMQHAELDQMMVEAEHANPTLDAASHFSSIWYI